MTSVNQESADQTNPNPNADDGPGDELGPVAPPTDTHAWGPDGTLTSEGNLDGKMLFWMKSRRSSSVGVPVSKRIAKLLAEQLSGDRGWVGPDGTLASFQYYGRFEKPIVMAEYAERANSSLGGNASQTKRLELTEPGVIVLTGPSGAGKSLTLAHTARYFKQHISELEKTSEPGKAPKLKYYYIGERGTPRHQDCAQSYAAVLNVAARLEPGSVVLVDSISGLGISSGGAAREGGVDAGVYDYVRSAGEIAQHSGVVIVLLANLLVSRPEAVAAVKEAFKGVADGVLYIDETQVDGVRAVVRGNMTVRPRRQEVSFTLTTDIHKYLNQQADADRRRLAQPGGSRLPTSWEQLTSNGV